LLKIPALSGKPLIFWNYSDKRGCGALDLDPWFYAKRYQNSNKRLNSGIIPDKPSKVQKRSKLFVFPSLEKRLVLALF
jgi:hypothetical protein